MGELDSSSTNSQDVDLDEELQPVQLNTQAIFYRSPLKNDEEKIHKTIYPFLISAIQNYKHTLGDYKPIPRRTQRAVGCHWPV